MKPSDLLDSARTLANVNTRRPRQADLRRAESTAYYAMFHCLTRNAANMLAGTGRNRTPAAWRQAYRALAHGTAKGRCQNQALMQSFSNVIRDFATLFVEMQQKRHTADYDPDARFTKSDVMKDIERVDDAIDQFSHEPVKDRRAFAIYLLLDLRKS